MNAIPTRCSCSFIIDEENIKSVEEIIKNNLENLKQDYPIETNIKIATNINPITSVKKALTKQHSIQLINILTAIRHGILRMHPIFKDKVDSSMNLGIVDFNPQEKIKAVTALYDALDVRSSCEERISHYSQLAEVNLDMVKVPKKKKQPLLDEMNKLMFREV